MGGTVPCWSTKFCLLANSFPVIPRRKWISGEQPSIVLHLAPSNIGNICEGYAETLSAALLELGSGRRRRHAAREDI